MYWKYITMVLAPICTMIMTRTELVLRARLLINKYWRLYFFLASDLGFLEIAGPRTTRSAGVVATPLGFIQLTCNMPVIDSNLLFIRSRDVSHFIIFTIYIVHPLQTLFQKNNTITTTYQSLSVYTACIQLYTAYCSSSDSSMQYAINR